MILVCTHGVRRLLLFGPSSGSDAGVAMAGPGVGMQSHRRRPVRSECGLPDGFYYGNLDPDSAMATVEAHLAGTVPADRLRGMARFLPPVQAAVIAAYDHYGPLGPSDLTVRATEHIGPYHGHGSETIVDLLIEPQQRMVTLRVLAIRRPDAQPPAARPARRQPPNTGSLTLPPLRIQIGLPGKQLKQHKNRASYRVFATASLMIDSEEADRCRFCMFL